MLKQWLRGLPFVWMLHTISLVAAFINSKLNISMYQFVLQLIKTDGGIQNMMYGAGISRTIWDFKLSGQPEVLLEFLPIKL